MYAKRAFVHWNMGEGMEVGTKNYSENKEGGGDEYTGYSYT